VVVAAAAVFASAKARVLNWVIAHPHAWNTFHFYSDDFKFRRVMLSKAFSHSLSLFLS
jgi:hypothetical protein